jgi:SAM-dependent methyltransferase
VPDAPLPPAELARRVGVVDQDHPAESFDEMGAGIRQLVLNITGGEEWFTADKRVFDFGCGPGKLLRHFLKEAETTEFYGCDIDEPSIQWLKEHHSPPLNLFVSKEEPGLEMPDDHIDLAFAMSVFTHLTDHWAGWLLEIHRVLKPGGQFLATFLGKGMSEPIAQESWEEDRIGMNILRTWQPWIHGGPSVQHSEWWLRAHWGRLFDFERVEDTDQPGHGWVLLRKRDVKLTAADLIAAEPNEPREFTALRHNIKQLTRETELLADDRGAVADQLKSVTEHRDAVVKQLEEAPIGAASRSRPFWRR